MNVDPELGCHARRRAKQRAVPERFVAIALEYGKVRARVRGRDVVVLDCGGARRARAAGHDITLPQPRLVVVVRRGKVVTCYWNSNITLLRRAIRRL